MNNLEELRKLAGERRFAQLVYQQDGWPKWERETETCATVTALCRELEEARKLREFVSHKSNCISNFPNYRAADPEFYRNDTCSCGLEGILDEIEKAKEPNATR